MHAISSYGGNRPTNTPKQTDRTDYSTLRRNFASAQCNNGIFTKRLWPILCGRYIDMWPIWTLPVADLVFSVADVIPQNYTGLRTFKILQFFRR